jgi:hypothetical protein
VRARAREGPAGEVGLWPGQGQWTKEGREMAADRRAGERGQEGRGPDREACGAGRLLTEAPG